MVVSKKKKKAGPLSCRLAQEPIDSLMRQKKRRGIHWSPRPSPLVQFNFGPGRATQEMALAGQLAQRETGCEQTVEEIRSGPVKREAQRWRPV